jgi:hypothetical protein
MHLEPVQYCSLCGLSCWIPEQNEVNVNHLLLIITSGTEIGLIELIQMAIYNKRLSNKKQLSS